VGVDAKNPSGLQVVVFQAQAPGGLPHGIPVFRAAEFGPQLQQGIELAGSAQQFRLGQRFSGANG
jgi:hypothetical protein